MDSQTQALFESPTISKYGISEINFDIPNSEEKLKSLKKQKIEEDGEKQQEFQQSPASPSIAPFYQPGIPSTSTGIRRQRFVIHPTLEPGPSNFGTKNVRESSPKPFYFGDSPTSPTSLSPPIAQKPRHHNSMRSVLSGPQLTTYPEPHQRTIGASSPISPISPQILHLARSGSYIFNETGSTRLFTDATSVRSLASFGLGSTDGRRMYIRKVPNSPAELMHILNPPT